MMVRKLLCDGEEAIVVVRKLLRDGEEAIV